MAPFLLDTNHLGAALDRTGQLRRRIEAAKLAGNRFGTCIPALCELYAGLEGGTRQSERERFLRQVLKQVKIWPLDEKVAVQFGRMHVELRGKGRVLSQIDMMLAAMCRTMNLTLLTTDRDFDALPDIRTENWLTPASV